MPQFFHLYTRCCKRQNNYQAPFYSRQMVPAAKVNAFLGNATSEEQGKICLVLLEVFCPPALMQGVGISGLSLGERRCTDGRKSPFNGSKTRNCLVAIIKSLLVSLGSPRRVPLGLFILNSSCCCAALRSSSPRTSSIDHDLTNERNETWPVGPRGSLHKQQLHRPKGAGRKTTAPAGEISSSPHRPRLSHSTGHIL